MMKVEGVRPGELFYLSESLLSSRSSISSTASGSIICHWSSPFRFVSFQYYSDISVLLFSTMGPPSREHSNRFSPTIQKDEKISDIERQARHISVQAMVDPHNGDQDTATINDDDDRDDISTTHSHQSIPITSWDNRLSDNRHLSCCSRYLLDPAIDFERYNPYTVEQPTSNHAPTPQPTEPTSSKLIPMSPAREILFIGVCAASHLLTQAGLGQALVPMDIIASEFHLSNPGQMAWFIAAYSLTVGTFIMISGQLGDIFGHKRVFAFGYAWLGMWSCFAGFSAYTKSQIFFDVCRAMQGIGPALLMPNALALFGRAYKPGIRKNIAFSIFGALAPAGFVIGATFASLFAELVWWPWGFWAYGIAAFGLCGLALLVIPKALGERAGGDGANRPQFDWIGSFLVVAGLVLVNVAFNNAPLYGWGTPHVYFLLIMGLMCLVAFIWVELRVVNPLLPISAFTSTVCYVLVLVGVGWGSFGIWVFYTVRFLQHIRHASPLSVSAQYAPAVIAGLVAAGLTGFLLTHVPISLVMLISMLAFCIGIIVACFMPADQTYWAQTFLSVVIMPFGMDMSFPTATVILSNHMPPEHQGLAASLVNTVVNYSISIALGIAGSVEVYAPYADQEEQNRNAYFSAVGLSGVGVLLGFIFFAKSMMKEGWVVTK